MLHAVLEILPRKPDLVVSGINYGENVGSGVTVSGTVGAALEAAGLGIPALAVSLETYSARAASCCRYPSERGYDLPGVDCGVRSVVAAGKILELRACALQQNLEHQWVNIPVSCQDGERRRKDIRIAIGLRD